MGTRETGKRRSISNGESPRNLKQVSGFGDMLCELSALQFHRLPFLRVQDFLNIRFHSLFFAADRLQRIFSGYIWPQIF